MPHSSSDPDIIFILKYISVRKLEKPHCSTHAVAYSGHGPTRPLFLIRELSVHKLLNSLIASGRRTDMKIKTRD
jgi:hypothetical protein